MKKLMTLFLCAVPALAFGQFGVSFHHSGLPFIGANFEIGDRLRPELRIGTDAFFEDLSGEIVVMYDILDKDDYEFYLGAGVRANGFTGLVIPIGLNFYPFEEKKFGFHIEAAPVFVENNSNLLRGSLGIRYRFRNE
jgi:hypothetical protein